jgi:lysophospholipase L1-like esterase
VTAKLLLLAGFVLSMILMGMNHRRKRKKIVFFGDSITELGIKPGGYITRIQKILREFAIDDNYVLVGAGVWGDKIYDLYLRLEEDILAKGADVVLIFIGVNDVWDKLAKGTGTDIKTFERFYSAIIEKLFFAQIKIVICTPAVIGEKYHGDNEQDEELDLYTNVIKDLAAKYQLPVIDLRTFFINYHLSYNAENTEQGVLTVDKVHLNDRGNQLVAEQVWKVLLQAGSYEKL